MTEKKKIEVKKDEQTARKRSFLLKKQKKIIGAEIKLAEVIGPVAQLIRRSNKVEYFENVRAGEWKILHTDGQYRTIYLDPQYIMTFQYGKDSVKGYICHEDFPLPLPEDPVITNETIGAIMEKQQHDLSKLRATEIRAQTDMIKTIGYVLMGLILAWAFYKLMVPDNDTPAAVKTVVETTAEVVKNTTATQTPVINRPVTII